ncbi:MAG: hypothetical protein PHH58_10635 [Rhodoferax sp.]|nr:hypothetical protein [Rhodoferax sp.]
MSPPTGLSAFGRALAALRRPCHALITPEAVVFDAGGKHLPVVQRFDTKAKPLADSFGHAVGQLFALMDQTPRRGQRVHVAVSDAWARPAVLTLPAKVPDDSATDTLVSQHYRRIYGELMLGWRYCWSQHATRLVAMAWPAIALEALQTGLTQRGCVLASARSQGLLLGTQLRQQPGACWLLVLARSHGLLVRLQDGVLQDGCVLPGGGDAANRAAQLPLQLARQSARRADACRALVIIDVDAVQDLPALRQTLLEAGWSSRVCAAAELSGSWVWRLQQCIRLAGAA